MATGQQKFTEQFVAAVVCPPGRKDMLVFDSATRGFGLRISASGSKTFLVQYNAPGGKRRQPLGAFGVVTLDKARRQAKAILGEAAVGDPIARRKEEAAAIRVRTKANAYTVEALISDWTARHLANRSPAYGKIAPGRLRALLADHLTMAADKLDRAAAKAALAHVAKDAGPVAANRARSYARACFTWAVKHDMLPSSPFDNMPAAAPERSRDRVLNDAELARVWQASTSLAPQWRDFLRMLVLTGQRRSEVSDMTWSELSADGLTWTIPPARAKNGVAHDVPLAPPVTAMLAGRKRIKDLNWTFSDGRQNAPSGFAKMKADLDRLVQEPDAEGTPTLPALPRWTLHDLRRTMATGLQRLGVRLEVTEATLNHVSGSRAGIVGVYQRHTWASEKRSALEAWAAHVTALVSGLSAASNVVPLAKAVA